MGFVLRLSENYQLLIVIDSVLWLVWLLKDLFFQLIDFDCWIDVLMDLFNHLFHLRHHDFLVLNHQSVCLFNMIDDLLLNHCLLRLSNSNHFNWLRVYWTFLKILLLNCLMFLMLSHNILMLCNNIDILAMSLTDLYQRLQIFLDHQKPFILFLLRPELLIALLTDFVLLMSRAEKSRFNRWRDMHNIADFLDLLHISLCNGDRQASLDNFLLRIALSLLSQVVVQHRVQLREFQRVDASEGSLAAVNSWSRTIVIIVDLDDVV